MRGKAPASAAGRWGPRGAGQRRADGPLLWEACRRDPDPAAVRRALDGGADPPSPSPRPPTTGSARCSGGRSGVADAHDELGPDRAVLGGMADAFKMEALLLIPRAVALAVVRSPSRARAGRLQGPGRGRPLSRARVCGRWRTSTSCSRASTTTRALEALARRRLARGARRRR